jgi:hypothetical protein
MTYCIIVEKWKSIKAMLTNKQLKVMSPEQIAYIASILIKLSSRWNELQPVTREDNYDTEWAWPERKDFPSINYVVRQIMELLNIKGFNEDFPQPSTKSSLKKLWQYWNTLARQVGLPTNVPKPTKQRTLNEYFLTPNSPNNNNVTTDSTGATTKEDFGTDFELPDLSTNEWTSFFESIATSDPLSAFSTSTSDSDNTDQCTDGNEPEPFSAYEVFE